MNRRKGHADWPLTGAAVRTLIGDADIEVIPLRSADEKLKAIPAGATFTVTTSAKLGLNRTVEFAEQAMRAGFNVVPHLAARQLTGEDELRSFTGRLAGSRGRPAVPHRGGRYAACRAVRLFPAGP